MKTPCASVGACQLAELMAELLEALKDALIELEFERSPTADQIRKVLAKLEA